MVINGRCITPDINPPIMIGSTEIKRVSKIKFLGVLIDEKLSWEAHVKSLTKKLASCTASINQIAASIPKNLHMNLYHTLFESYITYAGLPGDLKNLKNLKNGNFGQKTLKKT